MLEIFFIDFGVNQTSPASDSFHYLAATCCKRVMLLKFKDQRGFLQPCMYQHTQFLKIEQLWVIFLQWVTPVRVSALPCKHSMRWQITKSLCELIGFSDIRHINAAQATWNFGIMLGNFRIFDIEISRHWRGSWYWQNVLPSFCVICVFSDSCSVWFSKDKWYKDNKPIANKNVKLICTVLEKPGIVSMTIFCLFSVHW